MVPDRSAKHAIMVRKIPGQTRYNQLFMDKAQEIESCFVVKESRLLDFIVSAIFWIMFFSAVYYKNFHQSTPKANINLFYLTVFPAIFFLIKANDKRNIIKINKSGFYYYGELITDWENYISAKITQEEVTGGYSDNFVLLIEHFRPGTDMEFIVKIPLTNSQNKSEEEIMDAIKKFSN